MQFDSTLAKLKFNHLSDDPWENPANPRQNVIFYGGYMIFYEGWILQSNQSDYSICYK